MTNERFRQIQAFIELHDELPDSAFFALCQEHGITTDELVQYADEWHKGSANVHEKRKHHDKV